MLKTKVSTDSDTLKVQLQLTTPVPSSGNVIEMSFSTKYTKSGVDAYDSGLCIVPYWSSQSMDNYIYEANDLSTSAPLVQLTTTSQTFQQAYLDTNYLDTSQSGTIDWTVETNSGENTCTDYYCTFVCTITRPFQTTDSANDV